MPFYALAKGPAASEGYPTTMPSALVVAILDGPEEKEGRTTATLCEGFGYSHTASRAIMEVHAGYVTDFASIPRLVRAAFPPFGRHAKAAVLHDWLYLLGEPGQRAFADRVFLDAMRELGVSRWRRVMMFFAVRIGGATGYRKELRGWDHSFADWRTGDRTSAPGPIEAYWQSHWVRRPSSDFKP